ncbi:TERF1-interacting nuclear factor 2 isoform X2 [Ctenopharyngodon idella]|uniref:TERF1-interacting nuclear factor 2 isoform X2 n=1 Tax=Ctenopharyngodon idella TaxID=7959 RepID=UPI00222E4A00|nr:TERF1-interacting nuclear factor 2 isoform X2 [Ctenopharyngodon idella]
MKTTVNSVDKDTPLPLSALQLIAPPLRLMSAAMWKVMVKREVVYYGKLEEIVTSLCETVPGLLHYRHQARLTMGLRALMILEELRQSDPPDAQHVLEELRKLQVSSILNGRRKDQKVEEAKDNFQTLVHSLLKNTAARKQFFKEEFHLHYGGNYVASLEKLMWEFIIRVDKLLPVPDLAQTVSWLSGAPAVLEECARSASQPQLLRTLLQHEKCLGHLGSASLPSSTGDVILTSLSLPLSGRVLQTIQSEPTSTSNRVTTPARATRRTAKEAQSQVTPVIGSISNGDLQKNNEKVASSLGQEVKLSSDVSINTRSKLSLCSKKQILEKDPEQDCFVGNMLVTVISQSSGSEVEEEEEEEGSKEEINNMEASNERANKRPKKTEVKNINEERGGNVTRKCSTKRNSEAIESQKEALRISCVKRQLRVVLPRLNISNADLPVHLNHPSAEKQNTGSPGQPTSKERVGNCVSMLRKRKHIDSSSTPEKHLTLSVNKLTSSCSPCIPLVRLPVGIPETPSPSVKSSDDIIGDSDDDTIDNVKRKEWC